MRSTAAANAGGRRLAPPCSRANLRTASTAPLRQRAPADVEAREAGRARVNGTSRAVAAASPATTVLAPARESTIERPSGVSSARRGQHGRLGQLRARTRRAGMNSVAMRLPKVMVPVLSSSSVSTSPAASTARPEVASTLKRTQPVHAGDADGREQAADGGRDQA